MPGGRGEIFSLHSQRTLPRIQFEWMAMSILPTMSSGLATGFGLGLQACVCGTAPFNRSSQLKVQLSPQLLGIIFPVSKATAPFWFGRPCQFAYNQGKDISHPIQQFTGFVQDHRAERIDSSAVSRG